MRDIETPKTMRRKKELKEADFYNWWLQKYHNTTIEEIIEKEPELTKSDEWYKKYAVTSEQHDDWYEWCMKTIMNHYHISRKQASGRFVWDYLNVAPFIKKETDQSDE